VNVSCTYYVGDALTVMRTMPAGSVDLVLSSPAFLGLRSYLPPDHPDKAKEMGSEPTPGEFIDALLDVVEEADRALAPHGSLVLELGDAYAGSGGAGGDYAENGLREGQERFDGTAKKERRSVERYRNPIYDGGPLRDRAADTALGIRPKEVRWRGERDGWPLDKSLCLIPELLRFALAYGFNPLTGRQTPRWRVRNVVRWCRPNPPVGALADKYRPGTSEMVVACRSRSRYFDLDAVRGPGSENTHARTARGVESRPSTGKTADDERRGGNFSTLATLHDTNGAPPLDWWKVSTEGYPGAHYATWPRALLTRPILSMCPERVCTVCGEPSRRLVEAVRRAPADDIRRAVKASEYRLNGHDHPPEVGWAFDRTTLGWSDCGHGAWRAGVVLDPFAGTGTTGLVATGHGRSAVLIDLDERNLHLARERIGMFLTEGVMEASA
jgi:site-specific DNA-methyltransferase (adenine-specific)